MPTPFSVPESDGSHTPIGFLRQHRGPFTFCVVRPHRTRVGFAQSEWLPGEVDHDDVESDALALLADPRDTIVQVHVWSIREQQFVGAFRATSTQVKAERIS